MNEAIAAIPTEFKGVRFRSKSEAQFAWALEQSRILWKYEPKFFVASDNWVPDFHLCWPGKSELWNAALEYKPQAVTDTYRTILAGRFEEVQSRLTGLPFLGILAIGNAYDKQYEVQCWDWDKAEWRDMRWLKDLIFNHLPSALNYRFEFKEVKDE